MVVQAELGIQDYIALVNRYLERGLTDGLPVIPPSSEAVTVMCAATGLRPDHTVGEFPIRTAPVTVKDIAVNALMAGCLPEYMPVVLAGYQALFQPGFGTSHMTQSTGSFLPSFIVSGPIRHQLAIRSGANAFGPGSRANAAIGRAFRLGVINLAGSTPTVADRSTVGSPYRLSMVIGEDEEHSPWESLAVEHGFDSSDSTLVTTKTYHPSQFHLEAATPEQLLDAILDEWSTLNNFSDGSSIHPDEQPVRGRGGRGRTLLVLGAEHRALLAGWSKGQIRAYLTGQSGHARRGRTAGEIRSVQYIGWGRFAPEAPDDMYALAVRQQPEHILLVAAGGDGNTSLMSTCQSFDMRQVEPVRGARPAEIKTGSRSPVQRYIGLVERTMDRGLFDALPIVPPEPKGIAAMIEATGRSGEDEIGRLHRTLGDERVGGRPFTIGEVAAVAFMAGCTPAYMPVVTTVLEILLDPEYDLYRILSERDGASPWVVLNGPARQQLDINAGRNLFGPWHRSNAAMGRALNLSIRVIGGLARNFGIGTAFDYTGGLFGELDEESPWAPLSVEYGFGSNDSTVAVFDCLHPSYLSQFGASRPDALLRTIADEFSTVQQFGVAPPHRGLITILGADSRINMRKAGWTRRQAQEYVARTSGRRAGELRTLGYDNYVPAGYADEDIVRLFSGPEDVVFIAAGGGGVVTMSARGRLLDVRKILGLE